MLGHGGCVRMSCIMQYMLDHIFDRFRWVMGINMSLYHEVAINEAQTMLLRTIACIGRIVGCFKAVRYVPLFWSFVHQDDTCNNAYAAVIWPPLVRYTIYSACLPSFSVPCAQRRDSGAHSACFECCVRPPLLPQPGSCRNTGTMQWNMPGSSKTHRRFAPGENFIRLWTFDA